MPDLPRSSQNNVHAIQAKSATSGHATSKQITGNLLYGKLNANRSKKNINGLSVYTRTAIFEATAQHLPGPTSDPNAKQARLGLLWNSSHAMVTMNAMVPTNWLTQTLQLQFVPSLTAYFPNPSSHMVDPQDLIATVPLMPRVFFLRITELLRLQKHLCFQTTLWYPSVPQTNKIPELNIVVVMVVFDSLYGTQIFGFDMIIPGNHVVFATTVWQKLLTWTMTFTWMC